MRYRTKEWCALSQRTSEHLGLRVSSEAAVRSEDYYQRLCAEALQEELAFIEPDQREHARQQLLTFHQKHVQDLARVLPPALLAQVADLRVLALGVGTQAVKEQLTQWCEENRRRVDRIAQEAAADPDRVSLPEFCFHDGHLAALEWEGRDLILKMQGACFTSATGVRFENARVLEQDGGLVGGRWLYEEVYRVPGGQEYHMVLLRQGQTHYRLPDALAYLTVFAENAVFFNGTISFAAAVGGLYPARAIPHAYAGP